MRYFSRHGAATGSYVVTIFRSNSESVRHGEQKIPNTGNPATKQLKCQKMTATDQKSNKSIYQKHISELDDFCKIWQKKTRKKIA